MCGPGAKEPSARFRPGASFCGPGPARHGIRLPLCLVVSPPPQQSFGGAVPPTFARFALPLLVCAIFCVCATASPVTAFGAGGVPRNVFDSIILTAGGAGRVHHAPPEPPPTSNSPKICTLPRLRQLRARSTTTTTILLYYELDHGSPVTPLVAEWHRDRACLARFTLVRCADEPTGCAFFVSIFRIC